MMGFTSQIAPEYEAHLINDSDWILRDDTVYLGTYSESHYEDNKIVREDNYALYALPHRDRRSTSFGAHYGTEPNEYISSEIHLNNNLLNYCGDNRAIMVAIIRYLMMKLR